MHSLFTSAGECRLPLARFVFLFILLLPWPCLQAQAPRGAERHDPSADSGPIDSKTSLTIFATAGFENSRFYAKAFDRHLSLAGLQYGRVIGHHRIYQLSYAPEIIPIAVLSQPAIHGFAVRRSIPPFTETQYVCGLGANPLALELIFRPHGKVQPFLSTHGGFLYFSSNVPSVAAAQFNLVGDGRIGARIRLSEERALSVAYIFHHFSNGFEAKDNPGVDSQMIYVGYTFKFSGRHRYHHPQT